MSEIRALIEQLIAAGVDPIEAAEVVARAAIHGAANAPKQRSAGAIRQERYRRN
ncbi:DNA replication protein, partial [Sinorhizobium meliloti]